MRLSNKIIILIVIIFFNNPTFAKNLPRDIQGVFLASNVNEISVLLNCDKDIMDMTDNADLKMDNLSFYICVRDNMEILLFTIKKSTKIITGIIRSPNIEILFQNMFKDEGNEKNSSYKNSIIEKYGKPKFGKIFNVEKAMIWEDDVTILFVDELDGTGLIDKKFFTQLEKGFEEIYKIAQNIQKKFVQQQFKKPLADKKNIKNELTEQPSNMSLTTNEITTLKNHISKCWKPPIGAAEVKEKIRIKIKSNSDGSVVNVEIMDSSLYGSDSKYGAVADSARHAVRDCSPLPLPENKYELWKTFIFNFDTSFIKLI